MYIKAQQVAKASNGQGADADFARYLQLRPDAEDADAIRGLLIEGAVAQKRLN